MCNSLQQITLPYTHNFLHTFLVWDFLSGEMNCSVLASQIMWATCVYVEAVSVLPQLRMMQKAKVVEKFTAHYVFALGLSRFISCAHWILQVDVCSLPLFSSHPCVRTVKQTFGRHVVFSIIAP